MTTSVGLTDHAAGNVAGDETHGGGDGGCHDHAKSALPKAPVGEGCDGGADYARGQDRAGDGDDQRGGAPNNDVGGDRDARSDCKRRE
jgi:hypothetical protein